MVALEEPDMLRSLVAHSPVGMCIVDAELRYLYVNDALASLNGIPIEQHLGRTVAEIVPDFAVQAHEQIHAALRASHSLHQLLVEAELPSAPGVKRVFLENWFPVNLPGKQPAIGIIVREVTQEHRVERELREIDKRKDEFLALLAHELRNPLAPIQNSIHLLQFVDHPVARQVTAIMTRQLGQLTRLVNDLLDASRIRQGKLSYSPKVIDLRDAVEEAALNVAPLADARGLLFQWDTPPFPITVAGDMVRLIQLLTNLLNNAVKYTPKGGSISVKVEADPRTATVTVTDSGVGIDADRLPHVYNRFWQAADANSVAPGGLGLGLWLAKRIAELHKGQLELTSSGAGLGTTATFRLPMAQSESGEVQGAA